MPVFFMVAGFFGGLLFYERGPKPMIINRMKRIALPFMFFLLVLHPIIILAFDFTSNAFNAPLSDISLELSLFPQITYHLWFLYYLILLTLFSFGLASLLNNAHGFRQKINSIFRWLMDRKLLAFLVFGIMLFIVMLYIWDYSVPTPLSFMPDEGDFLFFLLFYLTGWILYTSKYPLNALMKNDWLFTSIAVIAFTIRFVWSSSIDDVSIGIIHALTTWMFAFGITGLFIRYTSQYSSCMRYVSDSSYWVFLVHLPLTAFIPGLMAGWMLPTIIKFLITLTGTTAICLVTYHFWVRSTGIGQFLNGRKYS